MWVTDNVELSESVPAGPSTHVQQAEADFELGDCRFEAGHV